MPAGLLVTLPDPVPASVTVNAKELVLKVAVTTCAWFIVTAQVVAVPLHAPPHPPNVLPLPGVCVSVTCVLGTKLAVQVGGQEIPAGLLETLPEPSPVMFTVRSSPPEGCEPYTAMPPTPINP